MIKLSPIGLGGLVLSTAAAFGVVGFGGGCAQPQERPAPDELAEVTFHVLGLQKTPSGAT